jgi:hypothetical protein
MGFKGVIKASVALAPKRSQIFVVCCAVTSMACLGATFTFIWFDKKPWEVPLSAGAVAGFVGFICWVLSHKNVDMAEAKSTEITMSADKLMVSIDPRSEIPKNLLQQFSNYLSAISNRSALPLSSGLVDSSGQVLEGSTAEAAAAISLANQQALEQTERLVEIFGSLPQKQDFPIAEGTDAPNFDGDDSFKV